VSLEQLPHDHPSILRAILDGYSLPARGDHGIVHWARVHENGMRLADATGADREVVALFAVFHDARRVDEFDDDGHGLRGGELARSLRGTLVHLDDARFDLLFEACRLPADGLTAGHPTLQACWDADRLDLGRVGITPDPARLCTDAARGLRTSATLKGRVRLGPGRTAARPLIEGHGPRHGVVAAGSSVLVACRRQII
jgi:uncharacterized protein